MRPRHRPSQHGRLDKSYENQTNRVSEARCMASGRVGVAISGGPTAECNSAGRTIVAYTAEPDSPSQQALDRLTAGRRRWTKRLPPHLTTTPECRKATL